MQKHTERLGSAPLASLLVKLSLPGMTATIAISLFYIIILKGGSFSDE